MILFFKFLFAYKYTYFINTNHFYCCPEKSMDSSLDCYKPHVPMEGFPIAFGSNQKSSNPQKMFIPTKNIRSMQRESPPKRGAAEPVNLKTLRNPAKTARGSFGLVRRRAHFFARISCIFKECASHCLGKWFWSF